MKLLSLFQGMGDDGFSMVGLNTIVDHPVFPDSPWKCMLPSLLVFSALLVGIHVFFPGDRHAPLAGKFIPDPRRYWVEVILPDGQPVVRAFTVSPVLSELVPVSGPDESRRLSDGSRVYFTSFSPLRFRVERMTGNLLFLFFGKVDLNSATYQDLVAVPGIGSRLAKRILDARNAKGRFLRMNDLLDVRGIGPKTFHRLRGYLTVDGDQ